MSQRYFLTNYSVKERSSITSAGLGGRGLNQDADTADALEGVGRLNQNDDMVTL